MHDWVKVRGLSESSQESDKGKSKVSAEDAQRLALQEENLRLQQQVKLKYLNVSSFSGGTSFSEARLHFAKDEKRGTYNWTHFSKACRSSQKTCCRDLCM